jgi:hypothetical protein
MSRHTAILYMVSDMVSSFQVTSPLWPCPGLVNSLRWLVLHHSCLSTHYASLNGFCSPYLPLLH